jgi:hypothetical protein
MVGCSAMLALRSAPHNAVHGANKCLPCVHVVADDKADEACKRVAATPPGGERCARVHCNVRLLKGKRSYPVEGGRVCHDCYDENRGKRKKREEKQQLPATPLRELRQPCVPPAPLLSPEQTHKLSSIVKQAGFGQQGRSLSTPESARVVLQLDAVSNSRRLPCAEER